MKRAELLTHLAAAPVYDLVVIGGGATGLGVALDATLRGFSVLAVERHDFASGTSSRSTKLLHGGVRYLAQGNLPLVREALAERAAVLQLAPHLAQPLPFVMPSYRWWQKPLYGLGLTLYDLLAGKAGLGRTEFLSVADTVRALPGLRTDGLHGGIRYWDGLFDDARLALALAKSVDRAGGHPLNYVNVSRVHRLPDGARNGARFELTLEDRRDGMAFQVGARSVVNAAGVWVDAVRAQSLADSGQPPGRRMVSPSQGVHIVVDREFMPGRHALLVPRTEDGRVFFAVPWFGAVILGTTDTPREDLPREPEPFETEIEFILREAGRVLQRPLRRCDAKSIWVGLRPLVASQLTEGGTKSLSREHTIVTDPNGLITVTGGKWTTYRAMAEDVMNACFDSGLLPRRPGGLTRNHALVGACSAERAIGLDAAPGWHLYGGEEAKVRACPGEERSLGLGLTEAMVRFAARYEYAWTVEDVLARRWRALFLDARLAMTMAPAVAAILRDETGMDPNLRSFMDLAAKYL